MNSQSASPVLGPHALRSVDDTLKFLYARTMRLGRRAARMVNDALPAYLNGDLERAKQIIEADLTIDSKQKEIRAAAVAAIARLQPVASDLNALLLIDRTAASIERIADHAKSIARRATAKPAQVGPETARVLTQLHSTVNGFVAGLFVWLADEENAPVPHRDREDEADELFVDLFHVVVADLTSKGDDAKESVQALLVGKRLERIGDHVERILLQVEQFQRVGLLRRKHR